MSKKSTWISILLAILLTAVAAHADLIYDNGDFEDYDTTLVPGAGDTAALPAGDWHFDNWGGYDVPPELMNVSGIGDGSGGTMGIKFPNWNVEEGWNSAITKFEQPIAPGQYTFTLTLTGLGLGNYNRLIGEVWWTDDTEDPWASGHSGYIAGTDWLRLTSSDNGEWQTHSVNFEILPDDPGLGNFFAPWIQVKNYRGHVILGEATLTQNHSVPEPGTVLLLSAGIVGLLGFRKRFKK